MELDEFGQKTLSVSWTRLKEWEGCHMAAVLHMQGKGEVVKDGRRFLHGTLADRAVRRFLEQTEEHKPGQLAQYVDDLWEEHAIKSPEYKINWIGDPKKDQAKVKNLAKKVVTNVEPFLFARVLPLEYQAELRFRWPVQIPTSAGAKRTLILNGGMDIVTRDPESGLVSIYDLKATENENYITSGIMPQLIFYSIAWVYMNGPTENIRAAFLTPACKKQYHPLDITKQDRIHLMTRIVKFAHAIWDEQEPVCTLDNNMCYFCDLKRGHCPRWTGVSSEDENGDHRVSIMQTAAKRKKANEDAAEHG